MRECVERTFNEDHLFKKPEAECSVRFTPPNRGHQVFFRNYCQSRGLESAVQAVKEAAQIAADAAADADDVFHGRGRAGTIDDDDDFQDAETHAYASLEKNEPDPDEEPPM